MSGAHTLTHYTCTIPMDGQQVATSIAKPYNSDPKGRICAAYTLTIALDTIGRRYSHFV